MSRKHILHDSIVIFIFLGSAIPLIFFLLAGSNPYVELDDLSGYIVLAVLILYFFAILFGSVLSIPAALLNYALIKSLMKYGCYNRLLKSNTSAILFGACNGLAIGTILFIFASIRDYKLVIEPGVAIFTHLPCVVSSVVFCLYRRKEYLTNK